MNALYQVLFSEMVRIKNAGIFLEDMIVSVFGIELDDNETIKQQNQLQRELACLREIYEVIQVEFQTRKLRDVFGQ